MMQHADVQTNKSEINPFHKTHYHIIQKQKAEKRTLKCKLNSPIDFFELVGNKRSKKYMRPIQHK